MLTAFLEAVQSLNYKKSTEYDTLFYSNNLWIAWQLQHMHIYSLRDILKLVYSEIISRQ